MQLKKLAYLLRYVPYQYKNKKMHNRAILKDSGMLESVPNVIRLKKCVIKLLIFMLIH